MSEELSIADQRLLEEHRRELKQSALDVTVTDVLLLGLQTDGAHHKQWALWRIAELLKLTHYLDEVEDKGIKP